MNQFWAQRFAAIMPFNQPRWKSYTRLSGIFSEKSTNCMSEYLFVGNLSAGGSYVHDGTHSFQFCSSCEFLTFENFSTCGDCAKTVRVVRNIGFFRNSSVTALSVLFPQFWGVYFEFFSVLLCVVDFQWI